MKHQSEDLQQVFIEGKLFWINSNGTWIHPAVRGGAGEDDDPDKPDPNEKATITQTQMDNILTVRINKAKDKAIADLLKDTGAESAEALKELIKSAKNSDDATKSELTKATEKATGLETKVTTLSGQVATLQLNQAVVLALVEKGMTVAAAKKAARLVEADDPEEAKVKAAVEALAKDMPQLFSAVDANGKPIPTANPGTPPPKGDGNSSDPAEIAKRKFFERHPEKKPQS